MPMKERYCPACDAGAHNGTQHTETIEHILLVCPYYDTLRKTHEEIIEDILWNEEKNIDFSWTDLSEEEKYALHMGLKHKMRKNCRSLEDDDWNALLENTATFLKSAIKKRNTDPRIDQTRKWNW
jgi:hypothetical protein